jgi:hypothetical protein
MKQKYEVIYSLIQNTERFKLYLPSRSEYGQFPPPKKKKKKKLICFLLLKPPEQKINSLNLCLSVLNQRPQHEESSYLANVHIFFTRRISDIVCHKFPFLFSGIDSKISSELYFGVPTAPSHFAV